MSREAWTATRFMSASATRAFLHDSGLYYPSTDPDIIKSASIVQVVQSESLRNLICLVPWTEP